MKCVTSVNINNDNHRVWPGPVTSFISNNIQTQFHLIYFIHASCWAITAKSCPFLLEQVTTESCGGGGEMFQLCKYFSFVSALVTADLHCCRDMQQRIRNTALDIYCIYLFMLIDDSQIATLVSYIFSRYQ